MLCKQRHPDEQGYVLIIIMMMLAILLIMLTEALPSVYTEAQREREKELIFRGQQYARAIYLFHLQFNRYPTSVKELLDTNGLRFLRQAYRDPMSRNGKWRFIHATANGIITDSETISPPGMVNSSTGQPGLPVGSPGQNTANQPNPLGFSSSSQKIEGAYIVGVAPLSDQQSIITYNHHTHYNHWEFLGIPGVPGSVVRTVMIPGIAIPSGPAQPGALSPGAAPTPAGGLAMPPLTSGAGPN